MKTKRVNGDPNHLAIDAHVDSRLQPKGYKREPRQGGTSWWDGRLVPKDGEVCFKLAYFGPDAITFGVREDLAARLGLLNRINCPTPFTVDPSPVRFLGFVVANDAGSFRRIVDTIALFP